VSFGDDTSAFALVSVHCHFDDKRKSLDHKCTTAFALVPVDVILMTKGISFSLLDHCDTSAFALVPVDVILMTKGISYSYFDHNDTTAFALVPVDVILMKKSISK